jgi:DNA-binding NtrC family response regulator
MLSGLRVLIVEDDAILARDLSELITAAEGIVVGPFGTVKEAREHLKESADIDAAILDVSLDDGVITPVLEALHARGIPTLVYTGGSVPDDVRKRHPALVALVKPVRPGRLIAEIRRLSGQSSSSPAHLR